MTVYWLKSRSRWGWSTEILLALSKLFGFSLNVVKTIMAISFYTALYRRASQSTYQYLSCLYPDRFLKFWIMRHICVTPCTGTRCCSAFISSHCQKHQGKPLLSAMCVCNWVMLCAFHNKRDLQLYTPHQKDKAITVKCLARSLSSMIVSLDFLGHRARAFPINFRPPS